VHTSSEVTIVDTEPTTGYRLPTTVFTLGYEGLSLDAYVRTLVEHGAGIVLDVREVPWSRKPGFSKAALEAALASAGIRYAHLRSCGNPSEIRKSGSDTSEILGRYRDYLDAHPKIVDDLLILVEDANAGGRPACLTCFERLPEACHRSVLANALSARRPDLEVVHLEGSDPRETPLLA
jgi:uncharacterized protein (DUF488 family)